MFKANSSIGIFGGSFDPPHAGHLLISKIAIKKLNLKKLYWTVTKKNPFKDKPFFSLTKRIAQCNKITKSTKKIKVISIDDKIKSSRTIDVIKYLSRRNIGKKLYLVLGSDNLVHFNKWKSWKKISKMCQLVIFSRKGYDQKAKKSDILILLKKNNIIFVKNKKINISSTMIRKKLK